jgi:hypothetical protein
MVLFLRTNNTVAFSSKSQCAVVTSYLVPSSHTRLSLVRIPTYSALKRAGVQSFGERGSAEYAANRFAAELLMPRPIFVSVWDRFADISFPARVRVVAG